MIDMPDVSPQYAPVVIAQASQTKKGESNAGRTIGICHLIENPPMPPETAVNAMSPVRAVSIYFSRVEHEQVGLTGEVSVLEGPKRGELEAERGGNYRYRPTRDYYGQDRATLLVEIAGRTVQVIYFFNVLQRVGGTDGYDPYDDKKYCPKGKRWKISLNPDEPKSGLISFQHLK
ncbi:MAG TPA: hypothetical protein VEM34_01925 [Burkholderiales bacterium]|nr:hypothetical protein [Burkholderiales bacterium]